ncbi:MAG: SurA N-terminal domain-containing protein [Deltaproteobacteria bacterium]|nr:SurA N-terminal domain-containing protein [Deltaproteobacteria bacterium]
MVKVLFGLIAAIFIFWGVSARTRRAGQHFEPVATVNGEPIENNQFQRTYNNLLRLYQDIYKDGFRPEMVQGLDLKGKAVDQLIRVSLMRQESERLGLSASETEIRDAIAAMKTFQQDGRFDKELYLRALRYNRITPAEFEDSQREELMVNKLQDLIAAGVHVTDAEARERFDFENEKINLKFASFPAIKYQTEVTPTDEDIKKYYDAHKDAYRDPEKYRVEHIFFEPEKLADKINITDADVKSYYDAHADQYGKPERVHARHILIKVDEDASDDIKAAAKKKADDILARLKAGEDFGKLAKENSQDPGSAEHGGDLGFFQRGQMVPTFDAVAFAMPVGTVSEPVESPFGYHIIKSEAKEEAKTQPLEEVRAEIVTKLKQERSRESAHEMANAVHTKVEKGATLESAAQEAGLSVSKPAPFPEDAPIEGLGGSVPLASAARSVEAGALGPVVDSPNGFVVFRLLEKIPSRQQELSEVHDYVLAQTRLDLAKPVARQKAEAFLVEAQKSGIDNAAKAAGLTINETGGFLRVGTFMPGIGNNGELKKLAFDLTPDKPVAPGVYQGTDLVVVELKDHSKTDDAQFQQQKDTLVRQIEQRRKNQVMEDFVNYLKARAQIHLNSKYLAEVADSGRPLSRPISGD